MLDNYLINLIDISLIISFKNLRPAHNNSADAMDTNDGCVSSKTKLKQVFFIKTIQQLTFTFKALKLFIKDFYIMNNFNLFQR